VVLGDAGLTLQMSVSRIKSSRLSKCHTVGHSAPPSSTILETSSLCKLGWLKNHFTVSSSQAFPGLRLTTAWKHCCSDHLLHCIMSHSMSRTLQFRALWCLKSLTVLSCLLITAALRSRCGHYIFVVWFLLSFFYLFSSPNLSRRRLELDVYRTSTHDVALVQI